jgi:hypothetical protein
LGLLDSPVGESCRMVFRFDLGLRYLEFQALLRFREETCITLSV